EPFPAFDDFIQEMRAQRPDNDMDVIGHHHPRPKIIPLAVKKSERACHQLSDARLLEPALPIARVEIRLDFLRVEPEQTPLSFRGSILLGLLCCREQRLAFRLILPQQFLRQSALQSERDEVRAALGANVREVSAIVTPGESRRRVWIEEFHLHIVPTERLENEQECSAGFPTGAKLADRNVGVT